MKNAVIATAPAPQIPIPGPQVLAPPPPLSTNAPQFLQQSSAPTEPTLPATVDRGVMPSKNNAVSGWKSSAWTTRFFGTRDQLTFTMVTATISLCLVVLMLAIVMHLTSQNIESSTIDVDSGTTKPKVTEGQTSNKKTIVTEPLETTDMPLEPTTSATSTTRPTPVTSLPPETTATETPKVLGPETLLCTYGRRTTSDAVMASDGLCDYAFYDSLYALGQNKLTSSRLFSADLETFIRGASKYKKTSSGMALTFEHLNDAERDLKNVTLSALSFFWWRKIFHVGILNTPESPKPTEWQQAIAVLKQPEPKCKRASIRIHGNAGPAAWVAFGDLQELDNRLEPQRALGHNAITVFAAPFPDNDWSLALARYFNKANFYPDLLIMPGHYPFGDNMIQDCLVMPPTRHPDDAVPDHATRSYSYDLSNGAFSLREFYASDGGSRGMLSVTLKGRWAEPKERDAMDFFAPCTHDASAESFGSYTEVCRHSRYTSRLKYSNSHYAMLARHATKKRTFAYDNEEGFYDKICKVKEDVQDVSFGIAAYDVDYDDYGNQCGSMSLYGRHSRLKTLRSIVDYFRTLIDEKFSERVCTSLAV